MNIKGAVNRRSWMSALVLLVLASLLLAACGNSDTAKNNKNNSTKTTEGSSGISEPTTAPAGEDQAGNSGKTGNSADTGSKPAQPKGDLDYTVSPETVAVLVNKQFALPENYEPKDLVYPDVPFTFKDKIEKRMMRKEAAAALEEMFAAAKADGINLAGVSAYRSHATQTTLFNRYVKKDGEEKAKTYSAVPGHSEHETGLAIDVSGSDGKCAAEDCFGGTKEAEWLEKHVAEFGYIIRYPEGKDSITGYKYEPWHIRYVGKDVAQEIVDKGITLEEYYNAVPVSK